MHTFLRFNSFSINYFISDDFHQCVNCRRSYKYKGSLDRHLKYECGKEPQFYCPNCPKKFHLKHNWERHQMVHKIKNMNSL